MSRPHKHNPSSTNPRRPINRHATHRKKARIDTAKSLASLSNDRPRRSFPGAVRRDHAREKGERRPGLGLSWGFFSETSKDPPKLTQEPARCFLLPRILLLPGCTLARLCLSTAVAKLLHGALGGPLAAAWGMVPTSWFPVDWLPKISRHNFWRGRAEKGPAVVVVGLASRLTILGRPLHSSSFQTTRP